MSANLSGVRIVVTVVPVVGNIDDGWFPATLPYWKF